VRQSALDLLSKEQRLAEIVRLIGPDALPDDQRLVLLSAEIIKNGFLQQNSYDEVDMYCVPLKQLRLLELIMDFHERALACLRLGAPLAKITSLSIRESLSRLKNRIKNDDIKGLTGFGLEMRAIMDGLEQSYQPKENIMNEAPV
jgi:V/A-type H+-transporting ATPase subunit A